MIDIYELLRRDQDGTSSYVSEKLEEMGVLYNMDSYGNIYNLDNENCPLLSAHMDTVRKSEDFCIGAFLTESDDDKIFSGGILGGDDKCGVYIILKVLEAGRKVNFIFSRDEEIGCLGIKALLKPEFTENETLTNKVRNCLWCLVLDRRGDSDIICDRNSYGTKEFEEALEKISEAGNFGYKANLGLCSDANTIRDFISTANISVGYWHPHSQKEYVSKKDLEKALNYTLAIIDGLKDKFEAAEYKNWYSGNYGTYGYTSSGFKKYSNSDYPGYDDYYDYYDDWGDYSWRGGSWQNKSALSEDCKCWFCKTAPLDNKLYDFTMPDFSSRKICNYCLVDLEDEINSVKLLNSLGTT